MLFASALHRAVGDFAYFEDVVAIADFPSDVEAIRTVCEVFFCRGAFEAGAHRVPVVFNDKDDGNIPEGNKVEGLHEGALIDCAVAEESQSHSL